MTSWNLERRMLVAALVWLLFAWGLGGTALVLVFRGAVVDRFDSKLEALAAGLAEQLERTADGEVVPVRAHPDFGEPGTGWYWRIDAAGQRSMSMPSGWLETLELSVPSTPVDWQFDNVDGPNNQPLRAISILTQAADGTRATLAVLLDRREIDREITTFTSLLAASALLLGLVLLAGIVLLARFALAPLRRLRADLVEVEAGRLEAVPENFPSDILPVAEAINRVLERDQALTAWARKSAGNLAHTLKTELALLRQGARGLPDGAPLVAQADRIAGIVDHHLARATSGAGAGRRSRADTAKVVSAVAHGLERLFAQRELAIHVDIAHAPDFRGEVQDLEEIVGNLMENACRHARSQVRATALADGGRLLLIVEDNGSGLTQRQREEATKRGERLDEKGPGAGLGLAIVNDLAELYDGALSLADSALGGLEARVELPAVTDRHRGSD